MRERMINIAQERMMNPTQFIQVGGENISYSLLKSIDNSLKELVRIEKDRHMVEMIKEIREHEIKPR